MSKATRKKRTEHHKNGSVRAKGTTRDGELDGYWEWFRTDGTIMRSGRFDMGQRVGEWPTYDKAGAVYNVTRFKT